MSLTPTQKSKVRAAISSYCVKAEANQLHWHYAQSRPFHYVQDPASHHVVADCSAYVSMVMHAAMNTTRIWLADPLGMHYSGWGYTGTEVEWLDAHGKHAPSDKYLVGDLVVYGHNRSGSHTAICRRAGTSATSVWSSNGSEISPNPVRLNYHPDPIVGVWRHPAFL